MDLSSQNIAVPFDWQENFVVISAEILETGAKIKSGKAPSPDGVTGLFIKSTMRYLAPTWAGCFTECLRGGAFLRQWKTARLVLIRKPGKSDLSPSSYRHGHMDVC